MPWKLVGNVRGQSGANGSHGKSAYELAADHGFKGSEADWLLSLRGKDGAEGKQGQSIKGDPGPIGPVGPRGPSAYDLAKEAGFSGSESEWLKSLNGRDGSNGKDAAPAKDGTDGKPGLTAFEVAKATGFDGSELEWLASLRGKDGVCGRDGRDGIDGKHGMSAFELAKETGYTGSLAEWFTTLAGRDGRNGEKGDPGRDALEIEVGDGVDPDRSYPRGEFRAFDGGMFRANRRTDPLRGKSAPADAGWTCVLCGIKAVDESIEDGGRFHVKRTVMSDGAVTEARLQTATPIYRGVYQAGRKYLPGDVVTFDGSQWTAKAENSERPRSRPADQEQVWQLSVKAEFRSGPSK